MFKEGKQKFLTSFEFEPGKVEKGYTDRRLYINLSENKIEEKPIDLQVKEIFTGGRGYGKWSQNTHQRRGTPRGTLKPSACQHTP